MRKLQTPRLYILNVFLYQTGSKNIPIIPLLNDIALIHFQVASPVKMIFVFLKITALPLCDFNICTLHPTNSREDRNYGFCLFVYVFGACIQSAWDILGTK